MTNTNKIKNRVKYTDSLDVFKASVRCKEADQNNFMYSVLSMFVEPTYIYTYCELEGNERRPFIYFRDKYYFSYKEETNLFNMPDRHVNLNNIPSEFWREVWEE